MHVNTTPDWTVLIPAGGPPSIIEASEFQPVHITAGALVDGYIETVNTLGLAVLGYWLIVDEEGRIKEKPVNELASYLYGQYHHGQPICGDAVVVRHIATDDGPDAVWLTHDEAEQLHRMLTAMGDHS